MTFALNTNLPTAYVKPCIAVAIDTAAPSASNASESYRVLLYGEQQSTGIAPLYTVQPLSGMADSITNYGYRSTITRMLRDGIAQPNVASTVEFYGCGVAEPTAGTAATHQLSVSVVDSTGTAATNPSAAGGCKITIAGGESVDLSWTTADTKTTIGDALVLALNALIYAPFLNGVEASKWANAAGLVTGTCCFKGALFEDLPFRVDYTKMGTGVWIGPGTLTFATSAVGAGTAVLKSGAVTVTTADIAGMTATQVGDALVAALALGDYPLRAGKNTTGAVPLYFAPGKDVRRPSAFISASTGTTATFTGGSATAGNGSVSSITYAGTVGAGYPTLTSAVANARAAGSYGKQVCPWEADATSVSAIFSGIVTDGDGAAAHQRGQKLILCSTSTEAIAKAFIITTTPSMAASTSPDNAGMRGAYCVCTDAAQPGYILAAHVAGARALSSPFTNYDGMVLQGTSDVPLLLPSQMARANWTDALQNTAIRDGLTPLAVQDNSMTIVFGRTTISTTDPTLWDWSWIDQADYHRMTIRAEAKPTFAGCALVAAGSPRTRLDVTESCLEGFLRRMLRKFENEGTYDGADVLAPLCKAQINPSQRSRADCVIPESPKVPLHTIGIVTQRTSPPSS